MNYDAKHIGNIIRQERTKRKWSQEKLGKYLNVTAKQVSKYEKGDPVPPMDMLISLCKVFECEMGYILGERSYEDGTALQTAIRDKLKLTKKATDNIQYIVGTTSQCLSFGHESEKYVHILNKLLSSESFPVIIEKLGDLEDNLTTVQKSYDDVIKQYGQELVSQTQDYMHSTVDYFNDPNAPRLPDIIYEVKCSIDAADDKAYAAEYGEKISRFELSEEFIQLVHEMYPKK